MSYLITGATGPIGRSIIAQLLSTGQKVRIVTRDPKKAPQGVQIVQGDFTQGKLPRKALEDVRKVFLFPAQAGVESFLKQLEDTEVEHIVVLSSLAAAMSHERDRRSVSALHHLAVEKAVLSSRIPFTFLRPGTFANNLLFWSKAIQMGDAVSGPFPYSAQAPIHEADVANSAVITLTHPGHYGKIYQMTGPQSLTRREQLETIANAIDRTLHFQEISPKAFEEQMTKYMPLPIIQMLLEYWSDTVSAPDEVLPTIEHLTGKAARTLAEWAKDHADDFTRFR